MDKDSFTRYYYKNNNSNDSYNVNPQYNNNESRLFENQNEESLLKKHYKEHQAFENHYKELAELNNITNEIINKNKEIVKLNNNNNNNMPEPKKGFYKYNNNNNKSYKTNSITLSDLFKNKMNNNKYNLYPLLSDINSSNNFINNGQDHKNTLYTHEELENQYNELAELNKITNELIGKNTKIYNEGKNSLTTNSTISNNLNTNEKNKMSQNKKYNLYSSYSSIKEIDNLLYSLNNINIENDYSSNSKKELGNLKTIEELMNELNRNNTTLNMDSNNNNNDNDNDDIH
ncbi:hypothetical protein BCR32DRAFT_242686 [Anaeromyces robustus]|uniref:Uncharacterized protein n=1 Tax=Anaeromyces robustus TaxID=1754192 RepID=A0A1Y1XF90_9FUNG|nr:hypothetical protein BCR32DRAFT_242686 [Anaeromyces robustus]|eukprot:ORX84352.1 hypothetical protein BCR32DRAFT_242686 [Anaeromyces robustus]